MRLLLLSVLVLLISSCSSLQTKEDKKPNIIFIMSDDHASHAISAYGGIYDELAPTPNIDRLAAGGITFNNVFCTNAICGPSRACILTGKYSHVNGYYKNEGGGKFDSSQWTFPEELQKNGYETSMFGKWHLGSEPVGFNFFKYHNNKGQQGTYWNPVYNENGKQVVEKGYCTNLTTNFAINWLNSIRNKEKPFCMLLQYKAPHRNWFPDSQYVDIWENTDFLYPDTFNDDYTGRENTAGDTDMTMDFLNRKDMKRTPPEGLEGEELRRWENYGNNRGEAWLPEPGMTQREAREWKYQKYIKDYLACVRSVDDNIGRVLDYLDENGLADNTVAIYTSDQGFYLGDHGFFDKRFMYEESLRMPFLMKYPGKVAENTQNEDMITNIDFAPTLLDIAGVEVPENVQGRSFLPNLTGNKPADWPDAMYYHYYEFPFWHHVHPHYGIRTKRYKLIHFYHNQDIWEFYDLKADPEELNNAIDNPKYNDIIEDLKSRLKTLMAEAGNSMTIAEMDSITTTNFGALN
ncbi:MAG: sulfatase [Prolixibacteraceae bacterium]|nr:sulfatase [Prolixibacteraceae bacterium]